MALPITSAADQSTGLKTTSSRALWTAIAVAVLLLVIFLQLMLSVHGESLSWDEGDHIFSGYMSLKHADFGLNPEHPPLVKMVAALPLLAVHLQVPELQNRNFKIEAFLDGKDFIARNDPQKLVFRARMAASTFALLLALFVFLAAREMFGTSAGLIALALLAFDPTFLAHGAMVTTDVGASCFILASIYAFYRCVKAPSISRVILAGLLAGCALCAKHTGILLFLMLPALIVCEMIWGKSVAAGSATAEPRNPPASRLQLVGIFLAIGLIAWAVLWSFYGFRYNARPAGFALNPTFQTYLHQVSKPFEVWVIGAFARWHLFPESYLYGIADIQQTADAYTSYFFGKVYPHGTRLYFLGVLAIKSTLPFLLFVLVAIVAVARRKLGHAREILYLAIPAVLYLAVAMTSNMNIGARHILPVYVFLYVLIGGAASILVRQNRRWGYVVAVLLLWQVIASLCIFPDYMAYANELWGGSTQTYKYLSDSNVDWAQQLIAVNDYLHQHNIKNCWFVYFAEGEIDTHSYGIPCRPLPITETLWWVNEELDVPPEIDGPVLISAGDLTGFEYGPAPLNPYEQFKSLQPIAVIQHGVYVFDGHFAIPLASAYTHAQKAQNLLAAHRPEAAFVEAQQAVKLAPDTVFTNAVMGDVLTALQRPADARSSYEKALVIARTVHPEFQADWIRSLNEKLAAK
jgi:hypothetical protein